MKRAVAGPSSSRSGGHGRFRPCLPGVWRARRNFQRLPEWASLPAQVRPTRIEARSCRAAPSNAGRSGTGARKAPRAIGPGLVSRRFRIRAGSGRSGEQRRTATRTARTSGGPGGRARCPGLCQSAASCRPAPTLPARSAARGGRPSHLPPNPRKRRNPALGAIRGGILRRPQPKRALYYSPR